MAHYVEFKPKEPIFPGAMVLSPDSGAERRLGYNPKEFYEELKLRANEDFKGDQRAIQTIFRGIDLVTLTGSQYIFNNYVNKYLPQGNVMTLNDLETIYSFDENFFKNCYADTIGICLRTEEPFRKDNKRFLEDLIKLVKAEGYKDFSKEKPLIISGLDFVLDSNSDNLYGLLPKLNKNTEIYYDERFGLENDKIKLGNVEKHLYTKNKGVSRISATDDILCSDQDQLHDSNEVGCVVVVNAEGVEPKILKEYINNLQKERDKQITEINKKYRKAIKVLKS